MEEQDATEDEVFASVIRKLQNADDDVHEIITLEDDSEDEVGVEDKHQVQSLLQLLSCSKAA